MNPSTCDSRVRATPWARRAAAVPLLLAAVLPAHAATFTVTTLADGAPTPAGSLRAAMEQAAVTPGPHTIVFTVTGRIVLAGDLPSIEQPLTVDGTGQRITIDGADRFRLFTGFSGHPLTLRSLYLTGANCNEGGNLPATGSGTCSSGGSFGPGAVVRIQGPLRIENSTIAGNRGQSSMVAVDAATPGTVSFIVNSTFADNRTASSADVMSVGGQLNIVNSTFSAPLSLSTAGSVGVAGIGSLSLANSIFSGPGRAHCVNFFLSPTAIVDAGGNLADDASCGFTQASSLQNTLAQLEALANNGGDTPTMKPATGSPAIDQGVNALAMAPPGTTPLSTDQRGLPRVSPSGGRVDRGSVEVQAPPTCTAVATPSTLWAPNRKLNDITVKVTPSAGASWTLRSVTSSEPDAGMGRDDAPGDIQGWAIGTADVTGRLRAERYGASSRIYTLTYGVSSAAGTGSCQAQVQVPANQKR